MSQILRYRNRPWQVGRRTDPALQPPGRQRPASGRRAVVLQSVPNQQGLACCDSDALTENRIEGTVRVANRQQSCRLGPGSPVAVAPVASLAVDGDITDRLEVLVQVGDGGIGQRR